MLCFIDSGLSAEARGFRRLDDQTHRDVGHHGPAAQNAHLHRTTTATTGCTQRE